jgi:hypothetical protein
MGSLLPRAAATHGAIVDGGGGQRNFRISETLVAAGVPSSVTPDGGWYSQTKLEEPYVCFMCLWQTQR